jgi:hypothetical protein
MDLKKKALKLGATDFGKSNRKNKRFYVIYNNKIIHFGLDTGSTFIDHKDEKKRKAWRARHSKIKLKDGTPAYKNKNQSSYWSYRLLWS